MPVCHADKISWVRTEPVWIDQWPLTSEKLTAATALVQKQLAAGHIEPTTSPWNTPIFVIKKKLGKWRLLQDLREINKVMIPMGALQNGLPTSVAIPKGYYKIVIGLKDCFFTIPLHPEDRQYFAFSLPVINFKGPMPRFQWKVLPQGMANSPTLCQKFVAQVIDPFRSKDSSIYIIHYMDDILLAGPDSNCLLCFSQQLSKALRDAGLQIAPDKIQLKAPYLFLGFELFTDKVLSQKVHLKTDHLKTLNDFQKLLGDINWLRPYLKLTTGELKPLFDILTGDSDPLSKRSLNAPAQEARSEVEAAISNQQITFIDYNQPLQFVICATSFSPTGVFWQKEPLYWVHLPAALSKVLMPYTTWVANIIKMGREHSRKIFGKDPDKIIVPYNSAQIQWLIQNDDDWAVSCISYMGNLGNHYPADNLLQFLRYQPVVFPVRTSLKPLSNALLVFTVGSSNGRAAFSINGKVSTLMSPYRSAQLVELLAVLQVFIQFPSSPFNLYTDSAYTAQSIPLLETVPYIKPTTNTSPLFSLIQHYIHARVASFYACHICAHSGLPGPLAKGNEIIDQATQLTFFAEADSLTRAKEAHALHHLNAQTLRLLFKITREQA
ncbi:endogenous retrovirus group K member 11 Pol protein isoform X1 [Oryctolagus cuniculus]|uniref:Reverse transcriptase domain-containing protein n=1 Tax=Oryctolagus cuniculus TaxID=9986 RepID=A0A5F9CCL2_RABIT|nr:endogenous retrovirus group K member 11 Pol protein isoform X1 [Oryctolagus cuniculus]XP_051691569.1 endogenous retrovirus group K member 11 Pol protein isoform X1 [Oryctolagus cuniculus]XP_051691570.1 endogenous retrovirus group K member 11 Pol protein isoform X1 [Oryctolagus cuniculus]XP_051691571.1 endogenous retrovirus group K member 11 Pol protein isoform X1 [Oryctolagus cuniculus]XP_051691572.1 endogenous retrovirus group K member 11 Pol protein isoform X1 [Oryctolagus cuniculus]XP_05